ncbi:transmembrane signal receptor [Lithospermum erythrorhizon]
MHTPTAAHMIAAKHILRYLAGSPTSGLHLFGYSSPTITAYSDSDWAGCPTTRRSTTRFCVFLASSFISWSSKKQPTVARSSSEAEYRALASTAAEVTGFQYLLRFLRIHLATTPVALCVNISETYLAHNPVLHSRTKHIAIDYYFMREKVVNGDLVV